MHFDEFLREAAPLLGLQWRPFQRRGIRRKVEHRLIEVGLSQFDHYLSNVKTDPAERNHLSKILAVTISRFFRDKRVFDVIETSLIPAMMETRGKGDLKIWSIGCASGEEPYSLSLLWRKKFEGTFPGIHPAILATDIDESLLERAKLGKYKKSSVQEVPEEILKDFFDKEDGYYLLDRTLRESVEFRRHHVLEEEPFPGMDLVLCRNLAFTYFSKQRQVEVLNKIAWSLRGKGYLVIGKDEELPLVYPTLFVPIYSAEKIYQKFTP